MTLSGTGSFGGPVSGDWHAVVDVLEILDEAVTIRDRDGRIAYGNRAALESMGLASIDELRSRSSRSIMEDYIVEDERGAPLTLEDVPSIRMMQGQPVQPLVMRTTHRDTGEVRWRQLKAAPVTDDKGELIAAVTVIEDVTAVKTAETRMRLLAESGRMLASSLDYQQTLRNVANVAVPVLADWCAVDLVDANLRREHVVAAHNDPEKVALAVRLREMAPAEFDPGEATGRVLRTGVSELYPDVTDAQLAATSRSEEHLQLLRALLIRSVLIVPMRVPNRTVGVMTLVTAESLRRLTNDDVELAEQLGRRAAVAVENARLHTTLSEISDTLQRSLRPGALPDVPGWEVASLYTPAGGEERIDVGGDFYEVFRSDSGWFAIIGDVTGKGIGAATLTGLLRHGSRFASRHDPRPAGILRQLDEALRSRSEHSLCTALCARLEDRSITISSAGHPPALLARSDGTISEVPRAGPLLGAFTNGSWPDEVISVAEDDLVLIYTDGVTEARGGQERFGITRLKRLLSEQASSAPAEVLARLDAILEQFRTGPRADDIAALAFRPARR